MKPFLRCVFTSLMTATVCLGTASALADTPSAAMFYPLVGRWHGQGQLSQPTQKTVHLNITLACHKAASGWAVRCSMTAKNQQMVMTEADLMGVDPVTGQAHWYAVTSDGETHDHLASWSDPHTLNAQYDWTQDGKQMHEAITLKVPGRHVLEFQSIVTADGARAVAFTGKLSR